MTATADYSDGKVPKNETAFPLCRAMDSLWNKNVVSLLSAVISAMRLPISCTSSTAWWPHEPAVSIATGKKDVRGLKLLILCGLVVCCLLGCRYGYYYYYLKTYKHNWRGGTFIVEHARLECSGSTISTLYTAPCMPVNFVEIIPGHIIEKLRYCYNIGWKAITCADAVDDDGADDAVGVFRDCNSLVSVLQLQQPTTLRRPAAAVGSCPGLSTTTCRHRRVANTKHHHYHRHHHIYFRNKYSR